MNSEDRAELERWRRIAELDERAGSPAGRTLLDACNAIEALQAEHVRTVDQATDHIGDVLRRITEAEADRDRAHDAAVALEQEVAGLTEELGQARLDEQYEAMATAGAFDDEEDPF